MLAEQAPSPGGDAVRIFDLNPPGHDRRRRRVRRRATSATATRSAPRATASTWCSTTSRRCRWPRTASCSTVGERRSAPRTCWSPRATRGVAKVVHTSSSAVFGIPEHNPVTEDDAVPAARGLRPGQARGRAPVPRRDRGRARRHDRPAPHDPRPRPARDHGVLFEFVADGAPVFVLGGGDNRYQFVHADDLADACLRAGDRAGPRCTTSARSSSARCARRCRRSSTTPAPARRCGRCPSRRPRRRDAARSPTLGLAPFAPYHWLLYSESLCFDVTRGTDRAGLGAGALERVDGDRVVRVVPRAPPRARVREPLTPPVPRSTRTPPRAQTTPVGREG